MNVSSHLLTLQAHIHHESHASPQPAQRLLPWLLDRRNLQAAWERVSSTDGANTPGVDGVTCLDVAPNANAWLARLADDLFHQRYRPDPPRWLDIPKHPGSTATRRLGILTIRDRLVHAALKQVLEPVLEPCFHRNSFGFRPGRSVAGALAAATREMTGKSAQTMPYPFAVHLDIADCFDSLDHAILLQELQTYIADKSLLQLIGQVLAPGGHTVGYWWWRRMVGLIQGSALSPLLCNLALHPIDLHLEQLAQSSQGHVRAFRYADDLLLMGRDRSWTYQAIAAVSSRLRALRLKLRDSFPHPQSIHDGVRWLGVRLQARRNPWLDQVQFGYIIPDEKVRDMVARLEEMTMPPSTRIEPDAFNLGRWIVSLNAQLRDWHQVYRFADNASEVFRTLDDVCRRGVTDLLVSVTGKTYNAVYASYRLWLPRGFWTWRVDGCQLVVLSSLPPRVPRGLTRKPRWMQMSPETSAGARSKLALEFEASMPKDASSALPKPAGPSPEGGDDASEAKEAS